MIKNNKKYYQCSLCGMIFTNFSIAQECEYRCGNGLRCHSEMIKKSVNF